MGMAAIGGMGRMGEINMDGRMKPMGRTVGGNIGFRGMRGMGLE